MSNQENRPVNNYGITPDEEQAIIEHYQTVLKNPSELEPGDRQHAIGQIALCLIDPTINQETTELIIKEHDKGSWVDPTNNIYAYRNLYAFRAIYYAAREYDTDTLIPSEYINFVNGLAEMHDEKQSIPETTRLGAYNTKEILLGDVDPEAILMDKFEDNLLNLVHTYNEKREEDLEVLRDELLVKLSESDNWLHISKVRKDSQRVVMEKGHEAFNLIIAIGSLDVYQNKPDGLLKLISNGVFDSYPPLLSAAQALHDQARLTMYDSHYSNPALILEDLIGGRLLTFKGKEAAGLILDSYLIDDYEDDADGLYIELENGSFFTYYGRRLAEICHDKLRIKEANQDKKPIPQIIERLKTNEAAEIVSHNRRHS